MGNKDIYVVVSAMEEEMTYFRGLLEESRLFDNVDYKCNPDVFLSLGANRYQSSEVEFITLVTGIGKVNASMKLTALLERVLRLSENKPDIHVLNIGSCCGVSDCEVFDIVEGFEIVDADNIFNERHIRQCSDKVRKVKMATGDSILNSDSRRKDLLYSGVDTYDMETYAYSQVCDYYGVRFSAFRFVSDLGSEDWEKNFKANMKLGSEKLASFVFSLYK